MLMSPVLPRGTPLPVVSTCSRCRTAWTRASAPTRRPAARCTAARAAPARMLLVPAGQERADMKPLRQSIPLHGAGPGEGARARMKGRAGRWAAGADPLTKARAVGQLRPGVQLEAAPEGTQQLLPQRELGGDTDDARADEGRLQQRPCGASSPQRGVWSPGRKQTPPCLREARGSAQQQCTPPPQSRQALQALGHQRAALPPAPVWAGG